MIDRNHADIAISRQCDLLGLPRSSLYYESTREERYNEFLMRLIDEYYTRVPFYGARRMTAWLRSQGHRVNVKRVRRLMKAMGLEALYPRGRHTQSSKGTQDVSVSSYRSLY